MQGDREKAPPHAGDDAHDERQARADLVERLFREHNEALMRFLVSRLRSPQEAREVAQEAYVRLLSLDEPEAVSYMRAFLFKTAANLAVDRMRRQVVRGRATEQPLFHEFADVRTPERQISAEQSMERLERLIAAMPPKCRQAFVLNRIHGMSFAAIAQQLHLSERSVRAYVVRALLYCRARIDLEGDSHEAGSP